MKKMISLLLCVGGLLSTLTACSPANTVDSDSTDAATTKQEEQLLIDTWPKSEQWKAFEIEFESSKTYLRTVYSCDLDVVFTNKISGKTFTLPAFWCGGTKWKARVAFTELGLWTYETVCSDTENKGLHGLTGGVNCVPYTGDLEIYQRGFLKVEKGTHYLMYHDGTPFFYLGDTHWTLPLEEINGIGGITQAVAKEHGITSQFKYIMDYRAAQGFTVIQTQPLGWYTGATGNSWFGDANGSIFDYGINAMILQKFEQYDRYFAYIAELGFVNANAQFSYPEELIEAYLGGVIKEEQLAKLCRYWVARYSAYPVMWTTAQEADNDYYGYGGCNIINNPWLLVMKYIAQYDPYDHPATCHQENAMNTVVSTSIFGNQKEHDWYAAQYTLNVADGNLPPFHVLQEYYYNTGAKPVINYEGRYDHFGTGTFGARAQGWVAFLNGSFGIGYGIQPIWSISWAAYGEQTPTSDEVEEFCRDYTWLEGLFSEGGQQLAAMKRFLSNYEWYRLEPCFKRNYYYDPQEATNYSVAHIADEVYMAYLYGTSQNGHGRFLKMMNGAYELVWFNCRTAETITETVTVEDGTFTIPNKPDSYDWVIALRFRG